MRTSDVTVVRCCDRTKSIGRSIPVENFRVDQVCQQFGSLNNTRAGTREIGVRVDGVHPLVAHRRQTRAQPGWLSRWPTCSSAFSRLNPHGEKIIDFGRPLEDIRPGNAHGIRSLARKLIRAARDLHHLPVPSVRRNRRDRPIPCRTRAAGGDRSPCSVLPFFQSRKAILNKRMRRVRTCQSVGPTRGGFQKSPPSSADSSTQFPAWDRAASRASARSLPEVAQTWQQVWVRISRAVARKGAVRPPGRGCHHCQCALQRPRRFRCRLMDSSAMAGRTTTGFSRACGGKSHSCETPTSWSPRPSAYTISVAAGRKETILAFLIGSTPGLILLP